MSATVLPWPTHRRCSAMLAAVFLHIRDHPPPDAAARDWLAVIGAVRVLADSDPHLARRIDTEFRRLRRPE